MKGNNHTNICFDCKRACGGCSWSENDPVTGKIRFEPVPGWTAERVPINLSWGIDFTYHITACPLFEPDEPRKRRASDKLELTAEQSRLFVERRGGGNL